MFKFFKQKTIIYRIVKKDNKFHVEQSRSGKKWKAVVTGKHLETECLTDTYYVKDYAIFDTKEEAFDWIRSKRTPDKKFQKENQKGEVLYDESSFQKFKR